MSRVWLLGGSLTMGIGIWSMHFIGMLAYSLPIGLRYDVTTTLLSLLAAILTSGCALWISSGANLGLQRLAGGALFMGAGISIMHYAGMAAIQITPHIGYDPVLVAASVGIAVAASFAALWLSFNLRSGSSWHSTLNRLGAAAVMGLAIAGMHYTGMAASHFDRAAVCIGGQPIDNQWLAVIVGLVTVALLAIVLITAMFDAHLQSRAAAQAVRLQELNEELQRQAAIALDQEARSRTSEERLRQISDSLSAMIAYWDGNAVCRFANRAHQERFGLGPEQMVGMTMPQLLGPEHSEGRSRTRVCGPARRAAAVRSFREGREGQPQALAKRIPAPLARRQGRRILCARRRHHDAQGRGGPSGAAGSAARRHQPHGRDRRLGTRARCRRTLLVRNGVSHPRSARHPRLRSQRSARFLSGTDAGHRPGQHRRRVRPRHTVRFHRTIGHGHRPAPLGPFDWRAADEGRPLHAYHRRLSGRHRHTRSRGGAAVGKGSGRGGETARRASSSPT